jgi:hypothetical protein
MALKNTHPTKPWGPALKDERSTKPADVVSGTSATESPKRRLLNERLKHLLAETEALADESERKLKNLPF